jgi:aryl-alcohol dehydrogenase-like predicted oxidoreductase
MLYRSLGRTGVKIGAIGIGCMTFGWRVDAAEAAAIIGGALDIGINLFDTSVSYGRGVSETMLGDVLKRTGRRNETLIATKFGGAATIDATPEETGNSRRTLMAQCELSLRRLQTDWIDLLQIHHFSPDVPLEETLGALDQLVRDGKVRYIGCSNFAGSQLLAAIECADRHQFCPIASHQTRLNLLDRRGEADVIPIACRQGIANLTYSPLAEGFLTGKYRAGKAFPTGSRFAVASPANNYEARLTAALDQVIESLKAAALACSMPLWRFALTWVLSNPGISCALLGPSNHHQIKALADLTDYRIDDELVNSINPPGACVLAPI